MSLAVQYNFNGAVVMISGAASGVGAATARACAEYGAKVIAIDVNAAGLATLGSIEGIETHAIDVADARAVDALIADVHARHGRIDAAVLAAAVQSRIAIEELSDAEWRRHMAVNLDGVFHILRRVAPIMHAQRSGSLLAFTSGLVNMGWPGAGAYAASKGALVGLMKCVATELREFGVRANVLSPGLLATPIFLDVASADEVAMYERSLGVSSAEAAVPSVLYLISDASKNMTGAVIERRLVPGESG